MPPTRDPDALRKAMAARRARRREEPPQRRSRHSPAPDEVGPPVSGEWLDVSSPLNAGRSLSYSVAFEWDLALTARGVAHRTERTDGGWRILAPDREAGQAMAELTAYRAENRPGRSAMALPRHENRTATLLALTMLLAFFVLTRTNLPSLGLYPHEWDALGSAQAGRILGGEWWRLATALTLHADAAHVLGNVVVGALFIVPICQALGSGQGWLLVLFSGLGGNLINALVQGLGHDSIGFSTCVFGAAGILAGLRARTGAGRSSWFTAVAAGLALLAVLGVGGERTDVGAHLFGFLTGLALGLAAAWRLLRLGPMGRIADEVLALVAAAIPLAAWSWAFLSH